LSQKRAKRQRKQRVRARARREGAVRTPEIPDRRSTFAAVTAVGDVPVTEETFVVVVEPIRLGSGDVLMFQAPHVPPFYLLTAKAYRDRAEPKRMEALTKTNREQDGNLRPLDPPGAFDALEGLAIGVILSAAAIEAHANDMIRRLPANATVEVDRKGLQVVYERDSMERGLNLAEKITLVGPMLTGGKSIKGTEAWEAYQRVIPLRNELMHMKSKAENDPDNPGPFGLLMQGAGSRAPEDAAAVIHAVEPDWIPEHVRDDFGIEGAA
jgi:hypothetical protein